MDADYYLEKLRDRVLEDPGSRLFLTLAEELRKRGEMEEAFMVLKHGIENNPAFASARLTLGRWYLKDEKLDEAKQEFTAVLNISPDDKFALRYMKEIDSKKMAGMSDSSKKKVERLNAFRDAIKKRFSPDNTALNLRTGDR